MLSSWHMSQSVQLTGSKMVAAFKASLLHAVLAANACMVLGLQHMVLGLQHISAKGTEQIECALL